MWRLMALVLANVVALAVLAVVGLDRYQPVDRIQLAYGIGLPERTQPPMLVFAHRGDVDRYPEDTLEAIEAAAAGGVDGIEFDLHRSVDGVWYVIHDPLLDRTTDLSGPIHMATSAEIDQARIDGGLGFQPEHLGLAVPRFEDVLEALDDYDGTLVTDLQHRRSGSAGEVATMLDERPAIVFARDPEDIDAVRSVDPEIMVVTREWIATERDGTLMGAVVEATVGNVRGSDRPVLTWVPESRFASDEEPLIRRAWSADVFAYLTKHPQSAVETVARLRERE